MDELKPLFRQAIPARIDALQAAREASRRGAPDAVESIRRIAHALRGSGGTYGFPDVSEAAARLEEAPEPDLEAAIEGLIESMRRVVSDDTIPSTALLIVEGDPAVAARIRERLAAPGRDLLVAGTADEAERLLSRRGVALILLDLHLPGVDGRDVLVRLRERPAGTAVPILLYAEQIDGRTRAECFALGADEVLGGSPEEVPLASSVAAKLQRAVDQSRGVRIDPLTGLANREAFREAYDRAWAMARRIRFPMALALMDLDHFKAINDAYGRNAGDDALKRIGGLLAGGLRTSDLVARWGGDEFAALFVNANREGAAIALDRVRLALQAARFKAPDGRAFPLTLTAGLAQPTEGDSLEQAIAKADRLLALGKGAGRNRLVKDADAVKAVKPRILIVALLRAHLEKDGFDVVHYPDGLSALAASPDLQIALVILDRKMPGMDGLDLMAQLRRQAAFARAPILMLTSLGTEQEIIRGFDRGADDYIVKPFSPAELMARIHRFIRPKP